VKGFTLKVARNALLAAIAVTAVISCVDTIDIQGFVTESERVQELILKGAEAVTLEGSDEGLEGGDKKVTGLVAGRYYKVEHKNADGTFKLLGFVKSDGKIDEDMTKIGKASEDAEIIDLSNEYVYRIKSAVAVPNTVSIGYSPPTGGGGKSPVSGIVDINTKATTLDIGLPSAYNLTSAGSFIAVKNTIIPTGIAISSVESSNIQMNADTSAEFIFYNKASPFDFLFLKINVKFITDLVITLSPFNGIDEITISAGVVPSIDIKDFEFVGTPVPDTAKRTITISANPVVTLSNFNWRCNDKSLGTVNPLVIDFTSSIADQAGLTALGTHSISVYAQSGSGATLSYWSALVTIEVTNNP